MPRASLPGLAKASTRGEGGAHEPTLLDMMSGGVQQLVGAVGQRQYRRELADDEVGSLLTVGLGAVIAYPGA